MSFNTKKCSILRITTKKKPVTFPYEVSGVNLAGVDMATYLEVDGNSNLSWGPHINTITAQTLNLIRCNLHKKFKEHIYITCVLYIKDLFYCMIHYFSF